MSQPVITVVTDYNRESMAVFVGDEQVYGEDPHEIDAVNLLQRVFEHIDPNIKIVEEFTYGRPYEWFSENSEKS